VNRIQLVGQAITSTNYATKRLFNFNPDLVQAAAENFLACGITEVEIPQGVLDPNGRFPETGVDAATLEKTVAALPAETRVVGTYIGGKNLGADNEAYLKANTRDLSRLMETFPDLRYAMLHPAKKTLADAESIQQIVQTFARLADHAASQRPGFELCFHNHFDTNAETAEGVRAYLAEIEKVGSPALRWGPDTGHCHGMGDAYLDVLREYAHLIGGHFHIKARIPAFDRVHGGEHYNPERDIWSNPAEVGGGLYSGFVNVADPEIATPFKAVFEVVRESAKPAGGVVHGALEIDNPRQHPRLEALCAALYLKNVHGIEGAMALSNDEIVQRVFQQDT